MAEVVEGYWVNFARTGDPNGNGLVKWKAFDVAEPRVMRLDELPAMQPLSAVDRLRALGHYFAGKSR
jgi:para-nitrobenzyl esterase